MSLMKRTHSLVVLLLLGGLVAGCDWLYRKNDLEKERYFAPQEEQVRRNTFEQSKAYNDGMVQELRAMQFEYVKADEAHKPALANVIKHRVAGFPEDQLPSDLYTFIKSL